MRAEAGREVRWDQLEDAYGPASEVPELLQKVRNARKERAFGDALGELCSHVLHQGTIYSSSPAAVGEIIRMLREASGHKKAAYYEVLEGCAEAARKAIADGRFIPCHSGGDPVHGSAILSGLSEARELFISDLADADPGIRAGAGSLLVAFANADPGSVAAVRELYLREPDATVRQRLFEGLIRVRQCVEDWPAVLRVGLARESEAGSRFPLLYALIQEAQPATAEDPLWRDFVEAFAGANRDSMVVYVDERFFESIHRLDRDGECDLMLEAMGRASEEGLLAALASRLLRLIFDDRRDGWDLVSYSRLPADGSEPRHPGLGAMAFRAIGLLLLMKLAPFIIRWRIRRNMRGGGAKQKDYVRRIEFGVRVKETPEWPLELSEVQKRVLLGLAGKPEVWAFRTNLWSLFGLPENAADLRVLVSKHN